MILQKHDKQGDWFWQSGGVKFMKTKLCLVILLLTAALLRAQTNGLTALLQAGLFEEQANRNLGAAIIDYQALASQFDQDRQLAATAIFRLGECYRAQEHTNEAAAEYQRIIRDFPDQQTLSSLSRQNLAGMGVSQIPAGGSAVSLEPSPPTAVSPEAAALAAQISGIEKLKSDPEEEARAVLAFCPDETLKMMLLNLPKLQEQAARLKANPQLPYQDLGGFRVAREGGGDRIDLSQPQSTNLLADAQQELKQQMTWIQERVDFILDNQEARLKVLQMAGPNAGEAGLVAAENSKTQADLDEDREILRIQQMIQNSPDLINAASDGGTPLVKAAYNGWQNVAAYLLDHGADVNRTAPEVSWTKELADAGPVTPLVAAVAAGNKAMTQFLIGRGADVNFMGRGDKTPLHLAAQKGFSAVAEVLLAAHADVNARTATDFTPLMAAASSGQLKMAELMISAGADVNAKDNRGKSALNFAIDKSAEILQVLLKAGADPNAPDQDGRTPLSFAAERRDAEMLKLLLAAKADPNGGSLDAPLLCAIHGKDPISAEILLQAGASVNAGGTITASAESINIKGQLFGRHWVSPLVLAASENELPLMQLLLKNKADPNDSRDDGWPLIFFLLDKPDLLGALLEAGADVNIKAPPIRGWPATKAFQTPLLAAITRNLPLAVDLLLQQGANAGAGDENGESALHLAAKNLADEKVFTALLDHGANPNVLDQSGSTPLAILKDATQNPDRRPPLDAAQKANAEQVMALLRRHGALDKLPAWDHIVASRPSANFSYPLFHDSTNHWNRFTLLDLLANFYESSQNYPVNQGNGVTSLFTLSSMLPFADLRHVTILRPSHDSTNESRLVVDLLDSTNDLDCSKNVPLLFGDVVEIPEREHALSENAAGLTESQKQSLNNAVKGTVKLVVHGQSADLSFWRVGPQALLANVLAQPEAQKLLLSSSDLSRVKVTRRNALSGKTREWILDCSPKADSSSARPGSPGGPNLGYHWILGGANEAESSQSDFWLENGDEIEVPEK